MRKLRSGFEGRIKEALEGLKRKFWYEPLKIPYTYEANYIPDFVLPKKKFKSLKKRLTIADLNGTFIVETKGLFDAVDRRKMLAVKKSNPHLDIRFVFQRDNYLTKSKSGKYSDWATKHGFPWAIGEIPKAWLKE